VVYPYGVGVIRAKKLRFSKLSKPGAKCTVCAHERRHQIDIGLVHQVAARVLAERFGLSKDAIHRHAANHLTPAQRAAILAAQKPSAIDLDALRTSESEGLLAGLVGQRARLLVKADTAMEWGDVKGSVAAENAIASNYTLVAKLLGQLTQTIDVRHTNLLVSPDYLRLRQVLVDTLRAFPLAARAVGAALHQLESDAARDITAASKARGREPLVLEHQPADEGTSTGSQTYPVAIAGNDATKNGPASDRGDTVMVPAPEVPTPNAPDETPLPELPALPSPPAPPY
jgi:hypothetical protein